MLEYRAILEDFARYLGVEGKVEDIVHTGDFEGEQVVLEHESKLMAYYLHHAIEVRLLGDSSKNAPNLTAQVIFTACIGTTRTPETLIEKYRYRNIEVERSQWPGDGHIEISTNLYYEDEFDVNLTINSMCVDFEIYHREKLQNFLLRLVLASEVLARDRTLGLRVNWSSDFNPLYLDDIFNALELVEPLVSIDGNLYRWSNLNGVVMGPQVTFDQDMGSFEGGFLRGEVTDQYLWHNKEVLKRSTVRQRLFDIAAKVMDGLGKRYQDSEIVLWVLEEADTHHYGNVSIQTQQMIYADIDQIFGPHTGTWFSFRDGATPFVHNDVTE